MSRRSFHSLHLCGALDRREASARIVVTSVEGPSIVADHAFTTGQIGQKSFEKVISPSVMSIGVAQGFRCYANKLPEDQRGLTTAPRYFLPRQIG